MNKMILFFSHELTSIQQEEAKKDLGVEAFTILSSELQREWSQIEPLKDKIDMKPFFDFLSEKADKGDIVMIQGDYGATCALVNFAWKIGCIPVYATSVRGENIASEDDDSFKKGDFKHCRFRRYQ